MNRFLKFTVRTVVCALLTLAPMIAFAQAPPVYEMPFPAPLEAYGLGWYLGGDLGPSFLQNFQSSRFGFPGGFTARTGFRFDLEPGYNFLTAPALTLGGEFETGILYNYLSSVTENGFSGSLHGDYYQVPILANLVVHFHTDSIVLPYVGVGGGGDYSEARIHSPGFFGYENTNDRIDPAVQGMAGVRFRINPVTDVGLGYKFLAAFPSGGHYIGNHSILANFVVHF
jgi:opacity protein-like surface antigen